MNTPIKDDVPDIFEVTFTKEDQLECERLFNEMRENNKPRDDSSTESSQEEQRVPMEYERSDLDELYRRVGRVPSEQRVLVKASNPSVKSKSLPALRRGRKLFK